MLGYSYTKRFTWFFHVVLGLGLSLAQSFVSQHQGLIEYESEPGRTRFVILLPIRSSVVEVHP